MHFTGGRQNGISPTGSPENISTLFFTFSPAPSNVPFSTYLLCCSTNPSLSFFVVNRTLSVPRQSDGNGGEIWWKKEGRREMQLLVQKPVAHEARVESCLEALNLPPPLPLVLALILSFGLPQGTIGSEFALKNWTVKLMDCKPNSQHVKWKAKSLGWGKSKARQRESQFNMYLGAAFATGRGSSWKTAFASPSLKPIWLGSPNCFDSLWE